MGWGPFWRAGAHFSVFGLLQSLINVLSSFSGLALLTLTHTHHTLKVNFPAARSWSQVQSIGCGSIVTAGGSLTALIQ